MRPKRLNLASLLFLFALGVSASGVAIACLQVKPSEPPPVETAAEARPHGDFKCPANNPSCQWGAADQLRVMEDESGAGAEEPEGEKSRRESRPR